jgi:hypothetical protein
MQLGTRWAVGSPAPERLPAAMVAAVAEIEAELEGTDTADWRWTLTWLEGRPIVELDTSTSSVQATGTTLRYDPLGDSVDRTVAD